MTSKLQELKFTAVVTGLEIKLGSLKRPTIMLLIDQDSYRSAIDFNPEIRKLVPEAESLLVINIVDLQAVPWFFHRLAKKYLMTAFEAGAAALPEGLKPEEYIVILPDWNGDVAAAIDINNEKGQPILIALHNNDILVSAQVTNDPISAAYPYLIKWGLVPD